MYSPSKLHSYSNIKQPEGLTNFKQETIGLLKQQSQKIKQLKAHLSSKEEQMMIKDEQIKFLKESINEVEIQNQILIQEKNELQEKIQKIVQEIQNYNQNVVKPICQEKQSLLKYSKSLKSSNQQLQSIIKQKQQQIASIQKDFSLIQNQLIQSRPLLKQQKIKCLQFQHKLSKYQSSAVKNQQQMMRVANLLATQQSKRQKLEIQNVTLNKQLNNIIVKHNSSMKEYEQRIKQIHSCKIDASEVLVYEQLVKSKQLQINTLKKDLGSSKKEFQQTKAKYLQTKQKSLKQIATLKLKINELTTDILNLKKSFQLERKIVQFQSDKSEVFYSLYQNHSLQIQQNNQLKQKVQDLTLTNDSLKAKVLKLQELNKDIQIQQTLLKTQMQQQIERLESIYQGKLVSLNLKIRTQQQALQKLKKRQLYAMQQNQKLSHQLQILQNQNIKIKDQYEHCKQTTQKSLLRMNNENYQIVNEMQQLYKICEQNVDNKRVVDKMKHIVHALLTGLHYCQLKLLRTRQKQRKLYIPYIDYFYTLSKSLNKERLIEEEIKYIDKSTQLNVLKSESKVQRISPVKKGCLRKFRVCVLAVIAANKIKSEYNVNKLDQKYGKLSGLKFRLLKCLKTRNKIHNLKQLMQKQEQIYQNSEETQDILCNLINVTDNSFNWTEHNYKKLTIDVSKYQAMFSFINKQA